MSTIASPREPPRRTPSSSARPSFEASRSGVTSPVPGGGGGGFSSPSALQQQPLQPPQINKRANRAALREYYNLRAAAAAGGGASPRIEVPDSEVPPSDIDVEDFNADDYIAKVTASSSLEELLRLYTRVVGEVRALDAEKKALVYDNYSKLIAATETIRKMRANMDPLNPMASTLDPTIAQIYSQASSIRETLREGLPAPDSEEGKKRAADLRRKRTRELAIEALAMPERLRALVKEGKLDRAREDWELPRKLLVSWKEKGLGGDDVEECIKEGDEVLKPAVESRGPSVDGRSSVGSRVSKDGQ